MPEQAMVCVRTFGMLVDKVGRERTLPWTPGTTVESLVRSLEPECAGLTAWLHDGTVRACVRGEPVAASQAVEPWTRVVLLPPVSGGSGDASARIVPRPSPEEALAWAMGSDGAAVSIVVIRAVGCAVDVAPAPDAQQRLDASARAALKDGVSRALVWHSTGRVAVGGPMVVVAAAGRKRKDALGATDALLAGLRGVATRTDLEGPA